MRRVFVALIAVATTALVAVGSGSAARTSDTVTCGDTTYELTVTSTTNDNSVAWGVGTISGGTHLIPTSFSFTATDLSMDNTVLFSDTQAKGNGNGQQKQTQLTCTSAPETATAGDLGGIPGVDDSDIIQLSFTVTGVMKP